MRFPYLIESKTVRNLHVQCASRIDLKDRHCIHLERKLVHPAEKSNAFCITAHPIPGIGDAKEQGFFHFHGIES